VIRVLAKSPKGDKSVIAWVIVAEGGNPAYPGFSAVEPKMVPWVFYFDVVLGHCWVVLQNRYRYHVQCIFMMYKASVASLS